MSQAACQRELDDLRRRRAILLDELEELDERIAGAQLALLAAPRRGKGVRIPLEQARDAAVKLAEFTVPELAEHLDCSPATAARQVRELERRGIVTFDRMRSEGVGRPAKVFAYQRPTAAGRPSSPRQRAPRRHGHGSRAVAGTGRTAKVTNRDVAALVDAARADGYVAQTTGGNHIRLVKGSDAVTLPSTPSDHRSIKNSRAQLRRLGIAV